MAGTHDQITELIDSIESQGFQYVIGIIKPRKDEPNLKDIDIYTNRDHNGLDRLLSILSKNQKQNSKRRKNSIRDKKDE